MLKNLQKLKEKKKQLLKNLTIKKQFFEKKTFEETII